MTMTNLTEWALSELLPCIGYDNYRNLFTYLLGLQCNAPTTRPEIATIMDMVPDYLSDARLEVENTIALLELEAGFAELERGVDIDSEIA